MKKNIYTIFDSKAKAYLTPVFSNNDDTVIREVSQSVHTKGSLLNSNPEDFSIFKLGEYDETTGKITPCAPDHLVNVVSLTASHINND